jgi:hypothetical protein
VGEQPTYNAEEPTDYNDLGVEKVHSANQPPGAAGAAAEANGLPLSKKRMTPLEKKTEGGSVPKLALSSDTDCSAIRLSSTLNEAGTCISVSLRSNTIPSKEDMVARLGAKLEAKWSAFSKLNIRGPTTKKHAKIHGYKTLRAEFAHMLVIDAALKGWQSGPLGYSSLVRTIPSSMSPLFIKRLARD